MLETEGIHPESPDRGRTEYTDQLRSWLGQAYQWQCIPYMSWNRHSTVFSSPLPSVQDPSISAEQRPQSSLPANGTPVSNGNNSEPVQLEGRVFEIPRLSKRLLAEVIDFGLLFFIKAIITLTVLDSWDLEDSSLFENDGSEDADYELAMAITANLLTIEFVHRILVVCYEVWFTHQGGTPGKRTMGIKILACSRSLPIGENRIFVSPATEITFWRSLGRAFLKNMGTALLFPTFLPLMVVQHNRTLYDIFCGTVVVESD